MSDHVGTAGNSASASNDTDVTEPGLETIDAAWCAEGLKRFDSCDFGAAIEMSLLCDCEATIEVNAYEVAVFLVYMRSALISDMIVVSESSITPISNEHGFGRYLYSSSATMMFVTDTGVN